MSGFPFFLNAPLRVFSALPKEKIYVVEADCDRPNEGKFLATLLHPDITLWTSVSRTHSMNFDYLVTNKTFKTVDEAIAFEYGYFFAKTKKLCIYNADDQLIANQLSRSAAEKKGVSNNDIDSYSPDLNKTVFTIEKKKYPLPSLAPKEVGYSLLATKALLSFLDLPMDELFTKYSNPEGRTSIFKGINDTTIIDSSYNANLSSTTAVLQMVAKIPGKKKWIVIADLLEQGKEEQEEHEKLAEEIKEFNPAGVVLVGNAVKQYTYPKLKDSFTSIPLTVVLRLDEGLEFLQKNLKGSETILFKGSQSKMLEGIIEHLLANKEETKKLPRREKIWIERRAKQGV